jgi:hypothetical protein
MTMCPCTPFSGGDLCFSMKPEGARSAGSERLTGSLGDGLRAAGTRDLGDTQPSSSTNMMLLLDGPLWEFLLLGSEKCGLPC